MTEQMDYESLYSLYQSCLDSNAHLQHELERLVNANEFLKAEFKTAKATALEDAAKVYDDSYGEGCLTGRQLRSMAEEIIKGE